jgi:hypothetical protein
VLWASGTSSVASVSSAGVVTAVGPGTTAITATLDGKTGSATLTVQAPPSDAPLSGSVADLTGKAVGGGTVEILSGTTVVKTVPVSGAGAYTVSTLAPGTYGVRLQPPLTHSMGPSEPAQQTVVVASGTPAVQSFVVQPALYYDDFQGYTTATLIGGCATGAIPSGAFFAGASHDMASCSNPSQISIDPAGGNTSGPKAVRYDWPAHPVLSGYTLGLGPRFNPPPVLTQLYVRFTSKESPGFAHGGGGALNSQNQYKFFLIQLGSGGVNGVAQFGVYLDNAAAGLGVDPTTVTMDMTDRLGNGSPLTGHNLGSAWTGQFHTWVVEMTALGTSATTMRLYLDGVQINSTTAPYLPGRTVGGPGQILFLLLGANINNGPDKAQSRWFRELGVYTTRPSLLPMSP